MIYTKYLTNFEFSKIADNLRCVWVDMCYSFGYNPVVFNLIVFFIGIISEHRIFEYRRKSDRHKGWLGEDSFDQSCVHWDRRKGRSEQKGRKPLAVRTFSNITALGCTSIKKHRDLDTANNIIDSVDTIICY